MNLTYVSAQSAKEELSQRRKFQPFAPGGCGLTALQYKADAYGHTELANCSTKAIFVIPSEATKPVKDLRI